MIVDLGARDLKSNEQSMSKTPKNSQVEQAIQTIETRYAIGKEILKQCGSTSPHGLITELGFVSNWSARTVYRADGVKN
jgi:hypothetical protein